MGDDGSWHKRGGWRGKGRGASSAPHVAKNRGSRGYKGSHSRGSDHGKSKGKGGGHRDRSGDGEREGAEKAAEHPVEAGGQAKVKDLLANAIEDIVQKKSPLQKWDFDGPVRQHLHAIHGNANGGMQKVHEALLIIHASTAHKERMAVKKWSAYILKLLRIFLSSLSPEVSQRSGSSSAGVDRLGDALESACPADCGADKARAEQAAQKRPAPELSLEVLTRVQSGQLLNQELHSEFICKICLGLCECATLLPCSHLFCSSCIQEVADSASAKRRDAHCPACRTPFTPAQLASEQASTAWLNRWIDRIQVCCAFAHPDDLPDKSDDPLTTPHAARDPELGLYCSWTGTVGAYAEHCEKSCPVARLLRSWQLDAGTSADEEVNAGSAVEVGGSSASAAPKSPEKNKVAAKTPDTGDFVVLTTWRSDEVWGEEPSLSVTAGDQVYISEVLPSGWARGAKSTSRECSGWLPIDVCKRTALSAMAEFSCEEDQGLLRIHVGDVVEVYIRDSSGWVLGSRRSVDGGAQGWFPAWVLG